MFFNKKHFELNYQNNQIQQVIKNWIQKKYRSSNLEFLQSKNLAHVNKKVYIVNLVKDSSGSNCDNQIKINLLKIYKLISI